MTIQTPAWLYPAYGANIFILVPVCYAILSGKAANIFGPKVATSDGLALLVCSLWLGILAASVAGLIWPTFFAPLLLIQIVYTALWLGLFILPLLRQGADYPTGISMTFVLIVLTYPVLFWLSTRPT